MGTYPKSDFGIFMDIPYDSTIRTWDFSQVLAAKLAVEIMGESFINEDGGTPKATLPTVGVDG